MLFGNNIGLKTKSADAGRRVLVHSTTQPLQRCSGVFTHVLEIQSAEFVLNSANTNDPERSVALRALDRTHRMASTLGRWLIASRQRFGIAIHRTRQFSLAVVSLLALSLAVSGGERLPAAADEAAQRFSKPDNQTPPIVTQCSGTACTPGRTEKHVTVAIETMPHFVPLNMLAHLDLATYDYYKRMRFAPIELKASGTAAPGSVVQASDKEAAKSLPTVTAITIPEPTLVRSSVPPNLIVRDLPDTAAISGGRRISSDSWLVRLQDQKNFFVTLPIIGSKPITAKIEAIREDGTSAGTYVVKLAAIEKDKVAAKPTSDKEVGNARPAKKKRAPQPPASKENSSYVPASEGTGPKTVVAKSTAAKSVSGKSASATKVKAWKATSPPAQLASARSPKDTAPAARRNAGPSASPKALPRLPYYELNENIRKVMNAGP